MKPISGAAPLLMVIANIADPSAHGEGVILWRTNEKSAPGIKQTRQVIDLAGFFLGAGTGFEPVTFRL